MRAVLPVLIAIVLIALILFGLYQCGPLGKLSEPDDSNPISDSKSTLSMAEPNAFKPAIYDDDDADLTRPDYSAVRLPEAERLQLEVDALDYIDALSKPSDTAIDANSASQFVGAEQTFVIDGETVTLIDLLDDATDNMADNPTPTQQAQRLALQRRLQQAANGSVFYVHKVQDDDSQGIWGVVQTGLKDRFARGLGVRRGEETKVFQVDIPQNADEKVANRSSFLGKVLHQKVGESMVYNQQQGNIGVNPDVIYPGQELVIIEFEPDELISIYEYFITQN